MRRIRTEDVPTTIVDRLVNYFDPIKGQRRFRSRAAMALSGAYVGARKDRRATQNWRASDGSADADFLPDQATLRDRSRDAARNNALGCGAINTNVTSVVGTGLSLQSAIDAQTLGLTQDEAEDWQAATEREFRLWAASPAACDAARTLHFYALQALVFRSTLESGDCFVSLPMIPHPASIYSLKLNVIEADRVSNPLGKPQTDELAGGVRRGPMGEPISYFVQRTHPGSIYSRSSVWDEVAAFGSQTGRRNVLHLYDKLRPGLSRGVPYLAPVLEHLREISTYTEAEIRAAVVSGMFTAFVTTESGSGLEVDPSAPSGSALPGSDIKMGYGAIVDLGPNEDIKFASPARPNTAFGPFLDYMCQYTGVALNLPKEVLLKYFTASYSAARGAILEAWRYFNCRREWLAMMFCQPVYEAWLEEAIALGRIEAAGFFDDPVIRAAYSYAEWKGDAPPEIDPLKAAIAAKMLVDEDLSTRTEQTTRLTGGDFATNVSRRQREEEQRREAGLGAPAAGVALARSDPASDNGGSGADDTTEDAPEEADKS